MNETTTTNGRRTFLKSAAVAGGAAAVAVAGKSVLADVAPTQAAAAVPVQGSKGYQRTPHVETYYRLARD